MLVNRGANLRSVYADDGILPLDGGVGYLSQGSVLSFKIEEVSGVVLLTLMTMTSILTR